MRRPTASHNASSCSPKQPQRPSHFQARMLARRLQAGNQLCVGIYCDCGTFYWTLAPMAQFYPPIEPFATHRLKVSALHEIHVEESGNRAGSAVVFVHGGPGGGVEPWHRQFFDPQRYRAVLIDQRGCGKSTPHAELRENSTWDLVADMEKVREKRGIDRWVVFGGSWGATLSLAYAETHPDRRRGP